MRAIVPGKPYPYVPKQDRELPKEEQTRFMIMYLSSPEIAKLRDNMYKEGGTGKKREVRMNTGTFELETLKKGLCGWENFREEDGEQIKFDEGNIVGMIDRIIPEVRTELAFKIRGERDIDEE